MFEDKLFFDIFNGLLDISVFESIVVIRSQKLLLFSLKFAYILALRFLAQILEHLILAPDLLGLFNNLVNLFF